MKISLKKALTKRKLMLSYSMKPTNELTNDGLDRIKHYYGVGHGDEPIIEALVARLQAAEDAMLDAMAEHPGLKKKIGYLRWRKAVGK